MTAGQDRHQGVFDHPFLPENDGRDRFLCSANLPCDLFGRADDHVLEFFDSVGAARVLTCHLVLLATPPVASSCHEPHAKPCLLYTSPSPRDRQKSRMPSSA